MSLDVKICGVNRADAMQAVVDGGARFVGFVFYPPSPRAVSAAQAADLAALAPATIKKVGLFVDPADDELELVLNELKLDIIQLHGNELPERIVQIRALTQRPIMKAIPIATEGDLRNISIYEPVVDWLLFDAKAARGTTALPGGNGQSFDWGLLRGKRPSKPWMLAGGIHAGNLAEAVAATAAHTVDVSSGVEDSPGHKNPDKIRSFLALAATL